jgi:hypothetical protein
MGSYWEVQGYLPESIRIPLGMGGVIEVCEVEPVRCLRAVETLVQP